MKKTLIALAAVAATSAAFAQSSVSLYGRIDLGQSDTRVTSTRNDTVYNGAGNILGYSNSASTQKDRSLVGAQNVRTSSRLGVTGSEDLGGGLVASFNWEVALNPDNTDSAQSGFGKTRLANLNLSGAFGKVQLGTFDNAFDDLRTYSVSTAGAAGGDFFNTHVSGGLVGPDLNQIRGSGVLDGQSTVTGYDLNTVNVLASGLPDRAVNSINYVSPDFNGFKVSFGLMDEKNDADSRDSQRRFFNPGLPNNVSSTSEVSVIHPGVKKNRSQVLSASYNSGPWSALVVFGNGSRTAGVERLTQSVNTLNQAQPRLLGQTQGKDRIRDAGFALSYDFGVVKPYLVYERSRLTSTVTSVTAASGTQAESVGFNTTAVRTRAYEFGATFPMGAFTPYVTLSSGRIDQNGYERANYSVANSNIDRDAYDVRLKTSAFQIGTTYDLSKRTSVYAALGRMTVKGPGNTLSTSTNGTSGQTFVNSSSTGNVRSRTSGYAFGLVHKF